MPRFLVESYVAKSPAAVDDACRRARLAASIGTDVSYVHTTFLPGDETVLHLFDAPSAEAVEAAGREVGLRCERIVEAIEDTVIPGKETGT
jgi:hypothetical protein